MKILVFGIFMSVCSWNFYAQTPDQVVDSFFEALNSKNHVSLKKLCLEDLQLHSLRINTTTAISSQSLDEFIDGIKSIPKETLIFEDITSKESIITEHLAQFTLPYAFYVNGTLSHSGTNVITLLNTSKGWKISYIADTRK